MNVQEMKWQVPFLLMLCVLCDISGQLHYVIPEEMRIGAVVGNIVKDLGLHITDLAYRNPHLHFDGNVQYLNVNLENGNLYIMGRIDRDEMCKEAIDCFIDFEMVAENPLTVFDIKIAIEDINDNPPSFFKEIIELELSESTTSGSSFPLESAHDPDIGRNSLLSYKLNLNPYFIIKEKQSTDGNTYVYLLLEKSLDREVQNKHNLILTAFDGGDPIKSGTIQIKMTVTDANDNAPVFEKDIYKSSLKENPQKSSLVMQITAHDIDEGVNGEIMYSFSSVPDNARHIFSLNPHSGEITISGSLDFEEVKVIRLGVEAKDGGGLVSHCKVHLEVIDENDNAPEIKLSTVTTSTPEDSPPGTVIALININDKDSGENGKVTCQIQDQTSLTLVSASKNYYKLLTKTILDREKASEYNITVIAHDNGTPPLSTSTSFKLQITDINDNAPTFEEMSYVVYVPENNSPGASIYKVKAADLDLDKNSQVTYSIVPTNEDGVTVFSSVSINSQTGIIYAQRTFDYEKFREFQIIVSANDCGNPSLSSNATVKVFITDLNDNSPQILYPSFGSDGSAVYELIPPSSEAGYLVTKVVAVDADSGHNAWLFFNLIHSTSSGFFNIGLHTGEIRTSHGFLDKDAMKQKVVIVVKDNGQPTLSTTATLNLVFAENVKEALPEVSITPRNTDFDLNFYLVIALAAISFLFLVTVLLMFVRRCLKQSSTIPPMSYAHGTLPYPYELYFATDSGKKEFTLMDVNGENSKVNNLSTDNSALLLMYNEDINIKYENDTQTEVSYAFYY
ncbi:hypothetical protein FKM82_011962 [Ascaphus truei]